MQHLFLLALKRKSRFLPGPLKGAPILTGSQLKEPGPASEVPPISNRAQKEESVQGPTEEKNEDPRIYKHVVLTLCYFIREVCWIKINCYLYKC